MNRRGANFRFIAFSGVTGHTLARGASATEALTLASRLVANLDDVEVLDCGDEGLDVWRKSLPFRQARLRHPSVIGSASLADNAR
jgi:hypothetical protein